MYLAMCYLYVRHAVCCILVASPEKPASSSRRRIHFLPAKQWTSPEELYRIQISSVCDDSTLLTLNYFCDRICCLPKNAKDIKRTTFCHHHACGWLHIHDCISGHYECRTFFHSAWSIGMIINTKKHKHIRNKLEEPVHSKFLSPFLQNFQQWTWWRPM